MLIQSMRLGEGGASLKEARGQLCTVKQTFFFFWTRYLPKSLSTCVRICIYVRKNANSIPKQHPRTFRQHYDRPTSHQGVCCKTENWDSFLQETSDVFIHSAGYFRGDSLQKPYLKPREHGLEMKCSEKVWAQQQNTQKCEAGFSSLLVCCGLCLCCQSLPLEAREGLSRCNIWAQEEISTVPSFLLLTLTLRMDWERAIWNCFCTCFEWFWSCFKGIGTCRENHNIY